MSRPVAACLVRLVVLPATGYTDGDLAGVCWLVESR